MKRSLLVFAVALTAAAVGCSPPAENNGDGTVEIDTGGTDDMSDASDPDPDPDAGGDDEEDTGGDEEDTGNGTDDCRTDGCPDTQSCDQTTGECVDCLTDNECGLNGSCDPATNTCSCDDGFHNCQGECVDDTSVDSCGDSCDPCPEDPNGTRACVNGSCSIACDDGFVFDDDSMSCVGCTVNADCTDPAASLCNVAGECVACSENSDCDHIADTGLCDGGVCVECSFDDDSACGDNSCNVTTGECTQTAKGSVETCGECVATSECMGIDVCVPMQFDGMDRGAAYCLTLQAGGCEAPYPYEESVTTIGGAMADICNLNEDLTTCEAVLDYGDPCADASDCGADMLDDGLCEPIDFGPAACTIPCSGVGSMECPSASVIGCTTGNTMGERWCGAW